MFLHINWLARLCPSTVAKESKERMLKHKYVRFQGIQDPTSCACQGAISVWVELSNLACDTGRGWHWSSHGCKAFKLQATSYWKLAVGLKSFFAIPLPFSIILAKSSPYSKAEPFSDQNTRKKTGDVEMTLFQIRWCYYSKHLSESPKASISQSAFS